MDKKYFLLSFEDFQSLKIKSTNIEAALEKEEKVFLKILKKVFPKEEIKKQKYLGEWGMGGGTQLLLKKKDGYISLGFKDEYLKKIGKYRKLMKDENVTVNFPLKIPLRRAKEGSRLKIYE